VISEKKPITSATRSDLPLLWILSFSTSVTKALPITKEKHVLLLTCRNYEGKKQKAIIQSSKIESRHELIEINAM